MNYKKINDIGSASRTGTDSPVFHGTNTRNRQQTVTNAYSRIIMWFYMWLEIRSYDRLRNTTSSLYAFFNAYAPQCYLHGIRISYIWRRIWFDLSENKGEQIQNILQPSDRNVIRKNCMGFCQCTHLWNLKVCIYVADVPRRFNSQCNTGYYCSIDTDSDYHPNT